MKTHRLADRCCCCQAGIGQLGLPQASLQLPASCHDSRSVVVTFYEAFVWNLVTELVWIAQVATLPPGHEVLVIR